METFIEAQVIQSLVGVAFLQGIASLNIVPDGRHISILSLHIGIYQGISTSINKKLLLSYVAPCEDPPKGKPEMCQQL